MEPELCEKLVGCRAMRRRHTDAILRKKIRGAWWRDHTLPSADSVSSARGLREEKGGWRMEEEEV